MVKQQPLEAQYQHSLLLHKVISKKKMTFDLCMLWHNQFTLCSELRILWIPLKCPWHAHKHRVHVRSQWPWPLTSNQQNLFSFPLGLNVPELCNIPEEQTDRRQHNISNHGQSGLGVFNPRSVQAGQDSWLYNMCSWPCGETVVSFPGYHLTGSLVELWQ